VLGIHALGHEVPATVMAVNADKNTISALFPYIEITVDNIAIAKGAKVLIDGKERRLSDLAVGTRVRLQMSAETDPSFVLEITTTPKE
jgi:hypothetical protein